jgi:hypothetical protein
MFPTSQLVQDDVEEEGGREEGEWKANGAKSW